MRALEKDIIPIIPKKKIERRRIVSSRKKVSAADQAKAVCLQKQEAEPKEAWKPTSAFITLANPHLAKIIQTLSNDVEESESRLQF